MSDNVQMCINFGQYIFFVPGFNNLFGVFNFEVDLFGNINLWIFLISVLLLSGLGAGAYPAFYISSYQPANIFRGKQKFASNTLFTRIMLTLQLILSFSVLATGIVFIQNNEYQRNRDWGYNQEQIIGIPINGESQFTKLNNAIKSQTDILISAGSHNHLLKFTGRDGIVINDKKYDVTNFKVGFDYLKTMGIRLKNGRSFDRNMSTDVDQSIIVNETFVKTMKWQNAIGKQIYYKNKPCYIIGVVEDFHYRSFMAKIEPTILKLAKEDEYKYLIVKTKQGTAVATMEQIGNIWQSLIPDSPFLGFFQDNVLNIYFQAMAGVAKTTSVTALIALLITCMGIFAMVSMNIIRRMKEISIHKVLGASVHNITLLVNKGFSTIFIIALIIAVPMSYFMVKMILDSLWEYHRALYPSPFLFALVIILLSITLTIFSQIYKAAVANPIDAIRDE